MNSILLAVLGLILFFLIIYYITKTNCPYTPSKIDKPFEEMSDEEVVSHLKYKIGKLSPKFHNLCISPSTETYAEEKSRIYLCLRDPTGKLYKENTIMYSLLHELTHIIDDKYEEDNHSPEFFKLFNKVLCKASGLMVDNKMLYDPTIPKESVYCGVNLSQVPFPKCSVTDTIEFN